MNQPMLIFSPAVMGVIYQIYSMAFFMLGVVIYMLPKQNEVFRFSQNLWLLGSFGILHGVVELLEFQRVYVESEWLSLISRLLLLISFVPLLEFGRRVCTVSKRLPRLSVVLIYSTASVGVMTLWSVANDPVIGLAAGARFFVGFPASMLTAFALFSSLKTLPTHLLTCCFRVWISTTSLAFFVYGLSTLFLTHHDAALPAGLPDQTDFLAWFGFPVQLLRGVCAMLITCGFLLLVRRINDDAHIDASVFNGKGAISITDANKIVLRVNNAFVESTGYSIDELVGKKISLIKSDRHDVHFYESMWAEIHKTGGWAGEVWDKRKNGEIYPKWLTITAIKNGAGKVTHYIGTHIDISDRKAEEEQIRYLAFYDFLTGLPNRRLLMERLKLALISSHRHEKSGALLFIDMDNFKKLNDTLGHEMGDLLLQQVAERLISCVRESDTVSRLGGDEFVVMLEDLSADKNEAIIEVELVGHKILATLNQNYQLNIHNYQSTPSIGVTVFDGNEKDMNKLLKQADSAMYQAKKAGRNTLRFYDMTMQS